MSQPKPIPASARRSLDSDLQTMAKLDRIMAEANLTSAQTTRVVVWFIDKYGVKPVEQERTLGLDQ